MMNLMFLLIACGTLAEFAEFWLALEMSGFLAGGSHAPILYPLRLGNKKYTRWLSRPFRALGTLSLP